MNKKEVITFINKQGENGRVTRNTRNEKEVINFINVQGENGR